MFGAFGIKKQTVLAFALMLIRVQHILRAINVLTANIQVIKAIIIMPVNGSIINAYNGILRAHVFHQ